MLPINTMLQYSKGNPGAMQFLMELMSDDNLILSIPICVKLEDCDTIRGTNLYVLWSDLCDKDMNKVHNLCVKCPANILEDACSRQDYSGRKLVKEYLEESKK